VVISEILRCKDTKRNILLGYLNAIEYDIVEVGAKEKAAILLMMRISGFC